MVIKCERVYLKRLVIVSIAILIYIISQLLGINVYSFPVIVILVTSRSFSYLPMFNKLVHISRNDVNIIIESNGKERKYEHFNQDKLKLIEASILADYDELILYLPNKQLHFVLSVYEKDIYSKYKEWNMENN